MVEGGELVLSLRRAEYPPVLKIISNKSNEGLGPFLEKGRKIQTLWPCMLNYANNGLKN